MTKIHDVWSNRIFEADFDDILRIIESIGEGVYNEIDHGRPVNKVDIMNDFYRQIGLPEVNSYPKEPYYVDDRILHWTLVAIIYEGAPAIELDSYFD